MCRKDINARGILWNSDVNASKNIYHLALCIVLRLERVPHLTRNVDFNQTYQGIKSQVSL